jgi:RNA polymerase sigma-70 factor, ECF subfamily
VQNTNALIRTDEHLESLTGEGTIDALERIVSGGLVSFYRRAYQLLGNTADAEDAVQDALLAAYTHLDQFKGEARMSTWLTSIVLNSARMQLRRRRHGQVPLDEPGEERQTLSVSERLRDRRLNPEDEYRIAELVERLLHFHRRLSPTLRRTFQLRDITGLSVRETARVLGVPCGTVKAQSARARKKLKECMRKAVKPRSRRLPDQSLGPANPAKSSAVVH